MSNMRKGIGWLLIASVVVLVFALAWYVGAQLTQRPAATQSTMVTPAPPRPPAKASTLGTKAPAKLAAQIETLGNGFDGEVGIAIQSVEDGWAVAYKGDRPFPQQSVSKLWVASTVMDRIDAGELSLDSPITLTQNDLTIFHQPVRKKIMASGAWRATISELLLFAMTQSDNTANEALFRRVGGRAGVMGFFVRKGLNGISMSAGERELQMSIAAMEWNPAFSYGKEFWKERNEASWPVRKQAIEAYARNPVDGAAPLAVVQGLSELQRGELISPHSSAYLLALMGKSITGPDRLKSGLSQGWTLAHKTGTGQVLQLLTNEHAGIATAYNDVGILTSPAGRHYAVAVMIASTMRPVRERQALMRAVTQGVIACGC